MLSSDLFNLSGLLVDNLGCMLDVVVDQFLVAGVKERCHEGDSGRDQRESPERNDLNEVVC